jgi:hypothetical protein
VRTLSNQTLPDKSSKPGSYPIIDVKNTITCSNEYNNVTFLNQDNIAIASENIAFKIPPSEEPIPGDPCLESSGGWFGRFGGRAVTWKGFTNASNGPGYDRLYLGTPMYQWFHVRVPYNWDGVSGFNNGAGNITNWSFTVGFDVLNGGVDAGLQTYRWAYFTTSGLVLQQYYLFWRTVYTIGKLSDWECTGAMPYKDNAEVLPCSYLLTPQDLACGGGVALVRPDIYGGINIPWNSIPGTPEAGGVTEIPLALECVTVSDPTFDHYEGYILQRTSTYSGDIAWRISGGRYRTFNGRCDILTGEWLAGGTYSLNQKNAFVWYPNNSDCCFNIDPSWTIPIPSYTVTINLPGVIFIGSFAYAWGAIFTRNKFGEPTQPDGDGVVSSTIQLTYFEFLNNTVVKVRRFVTFGPNWITTTPGGTIPVSTFRENAIVTVSTVDNIIFTWTATSVATGQIIATGNVDG